MKNEWREQANLNYRIGGLDVFGGVDYFNDESDSKQAPLHEADFYYKGKIGKWSLDLNTSALWRTNDQIQKATETSVDLGDQQVGTNSHTTGKLLAGKLVVSYPLSDKLNIDFGSEYTHSDSHTNNQNEGGVAASNDSKIKEQNIAAFAEAGLTLGDCYLNAGMRYEHVKSDYYAEGVLSSDMSRKYDNVFPNLSVGYDKDKWHTSLSFSSKTYRPNYFRLSGYTRYTSRHTYESGNPNLRPTDSYRLEWDAQYSWLTFSAEYLYNKNASAYMVKPFQDDADIALMYYENVDKIQNLKFYLGATPVIGPWHMDYTVGLSNQFFDAKKYGGDYNANRPSLYLDFDNTLVLAHNWTIRLDYTYQSRNYFELGVQNAWSSLDCSIAKSFLRKSLVVRL